MRPIRSARRASRFFRPLLMELETRLVPGFLAPLAFDAGSIPDSVGVGDFNGDGIPDLAVANAGSGTVSVLLGNGDGSFQTTNVSYLAGTGPFSVSVGDVNGDGWPDLVVANYYSGDVSILLNDGAWTGPHPGPSGGAPRGGRAPGRGAGVPKRLAAHPLATVVEAQLAEAAFPNLRRAAPPRAVADPGSALAPRDNARPICVATPAPAPRREEPPPPTHGRPVTATPEPLLDLVFADTLGAGSAGSLVGDHGTRLV